MPVARWIELTAEGMQRLGHVKALVSLCAPTRLTSSQALNIELSRLLRNMVPVGEPSEAGQRYFGTRKKSRGKEGKVELQDAFLSDVRMPSQTGSLTDKAFEDGQIVNLAVALGLLRPKNFSLTPLGEILQQITDERKVMPFKAYSAECNPYLLKPGERALFLFCLVSADGDVLKRLYPKLLDFGADFHRAQAGDKLAEVFREMASDFKTKAQTVVEFSTIRKLQEYARTIENQPITSHSGVREQRVTLRLEAFVDLTLLEKEDVSKYAYRFTAGGKCFSRKMKEVEEIEAFLNECFFQTVNECWGLGARIVDEPQEIIRLVAPPYLRLKSDLGYAPIQEMLLLANLTAIQNAPKSLFELRNGVQAVKALQKEHPDDIRFSVDRRGHIRYVKFSWGVVEQWTRNGPQLVGS